MGDDAYLRRDYEAATADMRALGMTSVRLAVTWRLVQPDESAEPNLDGTAALAERLRGDGFDVAVMVWSPPAWALGERCGDAAMWRTDALVALVSRVVERVPASVLIVGNEVNYAEFQTFPECREAYRAAYVESLNAVAPLIRGAGMAVAAAGVYRGTRGAPGDAADPWVWVDALARYGADFDVLPVHPYTTRWGSLWGEASRERGTFDLGNLRDFVGFVDERFPEWRAEFKRYVRSVRVKKCRRAHGKRRCQWVRVRRVSYWTRQFRVRPAPVRVWVSEFGVLSLVDGVALEDRKRVSEEEQAAQVRGLFKSVLRDPWFAGRVEEFSWQVVRDSPGDHWTVGLRRVDGVAKPAMLAWSEEVAR